jgi:hypothetical protein
MSLMNQSAILQKRIDAALPIINAIGVEQQNKIYLLMG